MTRRIALTVTQSMTRSKRESKKAAHGRPRAAPVSGACSAGSAARTDGTDVYTTSAMPTRAKPGTRSPDCALHARRPQTRHGHGRRACRLAGSNGSVSQLYYTPTSTPTSPYASGAVSCYVSSGFPPSSNPTAPKSSNPIEIAFCLSLSSVDSPATLPANLRPDSVQK